MIILDFGHTPPKHNTHTHTIKNKNNKTRNVATDWMSSGKDVEHK